MSKLKDFNYNEYLKTWGNMRNEFEDVYEYLADFVGYPKADDIVIKLKNQNLSNRQLIDKLKTIAKSYAKKSYRKTYW